MRDARPLPRQQKLLILLVGLALALGLAGGAAAKKRPKLFVSGNGVDSATCGTKADPCRSISQAIANAESGSKVIVGPGRYGDINADGDFDDPGEETPTDPFCGCMIQVDKELQILSRDGAHATVLDAAGANVSVVEIRGYQYVVQDFVFGKPGRGFTLMRGRIGLEVPQGHGRVGGNLAVGNRNGFWLDSGPLVIEGNLAIANEVSGFENQNAANSLVDNVAIANGLGFRDGSQVPGGEYFHNVSAGNTVHGFQTLSNSSIRIAENVIAGNVQVGVDLGFTPDTKITGSAIVGNGSCGIRFANADEEQPFMFQVKNSDLYGNGERCGIWHTWDNPVAIDARKVFWGSPEGPGVEPADGLVDIPIESVLVDPVAAEEFRVELGELPFR